MLQDLFSIAIFLSFIYIEVATDETKEPDIPNFSARLLNINPENNIVSIPKRDNSTPVTVEVNLVIQSITGVNIQDMEFTIVVILRQRWIDYRLPRLVKFINTSIMPQSYRSQLWMPDTYFLNSREGHLHRITQTNEMVWIQENGIVTYSQKLSIRLFCHMRFWNFPMDVQNCPVKIVSYGYAKADLEFRWWNHAGYLQNDNDSSTWNEAVEFIHDFEVNEFENPNHRCDVCQDKNRITGEFACLSVFLRLQRKYGFYIIYGYLPSVLVVIIAWLSFLIDHRAVPARVSLGLLSALALITHSASILANLPNVSYVKAIDLWFFICLAFVSCTLVELAIVNQLCMCDNHKSDALKMQELISNVLTRLIDVYPQVNSRSKPDPNNDLEKGLRDPTISEQRSNAYSLSERCAHWVDSICVIAYPVFFIIFNTVYWAVYATAY